MSETKISLKKRVQDILKLPDDTVLIGNDALFMLDLLRKHPKSSDDCVGVQIGRNDFGDKCFFVVRANGDRVGLGYNECIYPSTPYKKFSDTCRKTSDVHTRAFSKAVFDCTPSMVCEVTGEGFSKSNSDVDHAPPVTFKFLVDSFISVNGIDVELVQYVPESRSGHGKGSVFADPELLDRWLQFHRQHVGCREQFFTQRTLAEILG